LLDRLQNGTHRGKEGAADQSIHGRMGLGTACKAETSRTKNVSIDSSGGKKKSIWVEENCDFTENFYIKRIYYFINIFTFKLLSIDISGPVSRNATARVENVMLGSCVRC
jgi:hypothetical protein